MELEKVIEVVQHYAKNKSYRSIDNIDREFIIELHDRLIPMDIPLYKANSGGCYACIRKAMARFVVHIDTLVSYVEDRKPKAESRTTQPKKKRGRPKRKK